MTTFGCGNKEDKNIIKNILKCYKCRNIIDFNNIIHIYECINCSKIFCENCVMHCTDCDVYTNNYEYIHCFNCKNKCFGIINNQLKENQLKNDYNNEYFKNIIFDTYNKSIY